MTQRRRLRSHCQFLEHLSVNEASIGKEQLQGRFVIPRDSVSGGVILSEAIVILSEATDPRPPVKGPSIGTPKILRLTAQDDLPLFRDAPLGMTR